MARAKGGFKTHRRHKRLLKQAEGFYGRRATSYRTAKDAVDRAGVYAYKGRKQRKRNFRALWTIRLGVASRGEGLSYSKLIHCLKMKQVELNRKMLSEIAIHHPADFKQIVAFVA